MLWTGLGFTAIGWAVLLCTLWADAHVRLVLKVEQTPRPWDAFGCLLMVGIVSTVVGDVLLFVHHWLWGAGALIAGILWTVTLPARADRLVLRVLLRENARLAAKKGELLDELREAPSPEDDDDGEGEGEKPSL